MGAEVPRAGGCVASQITDTHGHRLSIRSGDLGSTTAMTCSLQGSAEHICLVTFNPARLAQLKAGQAVMVSSTMAFDHHHGMTVACQGRLDRATGFRR